MTKKKPITQKKNEIVRAPIDTRSRLERAAQDDPVIAENFDLTEDQLLQCRRCDFVTRQELNALRHLGFIHPETIEPPAK